MLRGRHFVFSGVAMEESSLEISHRIMEWILIISQEADCYSNSITIQIILLFALSPGTESVCITKEKLCVFDQEMSDLGMC
ncbi:hypothetical protein CEXT_506941 [Caerostris extrusa]|uniref:Uncharacterized protein n=1 Tax=Caerostris extrusa TaxID=172846 RepID=A0AAV4ML74_CAEEX|nr:hypothetical protein CEXT_506941 [Caerostris extrusa]